MATYIQNLLNSALGDGARATKFDADIFFRNPALFSDFQSQRTLVKTASFPGKQHSQIDLRYKGRVIPVKGQTKYTQLWSCTYYLPEDHKLKAAFGTWIESLDQLHNYSSDVAKIPGLAQSQKLNAESYVTEIHLFQKNFENSQDTAHYIIRNAFPVEVSQLEYSAESVGQIQEFTVTFAYSHYDVAVLKGKDGNFIDELVDKVKTGVSDFINTGLGQLGSLASDAIGAGKFELDSIPTDVNINDVVAKVNETALSTSKQIAQAPSDMVSSIHDTVKSGGSGFGTGIATFRAMAAAQAGNLGLADDDD